MLSTSATRCHANSLPICTKYACSTRDEKSSLDIIYEIADTTQFLIVHERVTVEFFGFCFPDLQTLRIVAEFVLFGGMLRCSTRRGRAPANNSDVLAMFRLVYSGEGAIQPLVDDAS